MIAVKARAVAARHEPRVSQRDQPATPVAPLVYACSGCSNVGQLAHDLARRLDELGVAEMSCTTGVGGGVPTLLRKARSGRYVVAIDGCPLCCAAACLTRAEVAIDRHLMLADEGLRKRRRDEGTGDALTRLSSELSAELARAPRRPEPEGAGVRPEPHEPR